MGGKARLLTDEQREFFLQHQAGRTALDLIALMKEAFGLQLKVSQIRDQRVTLGVRCGKLINSRSSKRLLTPEQEQFFIAHQKGLLLQEAADLMNKTFGLQLQAKHIKQSRRTLHVTGEGAYRGAKIKRNAGMFQLNSRPHNYLPVGTETVKTDGYLWRKVAEPNKWRQVHILVWEAAHGPKPKGSKILFLNGNKLDVRLDNLFEVDSAVNYYLNRLHMRYERPELTKAGIQVAQLLAACRARERSVSNGRRKKAE